MPLFSEEGGSNPAEWLVNITTQVRTLSEHPDCSMLLTATDTKTLTAGKLKHLGVKHVLHPKVISKVSQSNGGCTPPILNM